LKNLAFRWIRQRREPTLTPLLDFCCVSKAAILLDRVRLRRVAPNKYPANFRPALQEPEALNRVLGVCFSGEPPPLPTHHNAVVLTHDGLRRKAPTDGLSAR
jgi:hypothetical protein